MTRAFKPKSPPLKRVVKQVQIKNERVVSSLSHVPGLGSFVTSVPNEDDVTAGYITDVICTAVIYPMPWHPLNKRSYLLVSEVDNLCVQRLFRSSTLHTKSVRTLKRLSKSNYESLRNAAEYHLAKRKVKN